MSLIELGLKDFKSWGSRAGVETCHLHSHDVNCMGMDMALWHGELRTMVIWISCSFLDLKLFCEYHPLSVCSNGRRRVYGHDQLGDWCTNWLVGAGGTP